MSSAMQGIECVHKRRFLMNRTVRLLLLAGSLAVTAAPSASSLTTLQTCSYSCFDHSTHPFQVHHYSFDSTYQQCCSADTTNFCDPGMNLIGLAWGDPPTKCGS